MEGWLWRWRRPCVWAWLREDFPWLLLLDLSKIGAGIRALKRTGVARIGATRCRRGLLRSSGNSGVLRESSANAGRKRAENCVLPRMKERTGRRLAIGS